MAQVHPTAVVHPEAQLHETVEVGPYAVIGPKVRIGAGTRVGPHVVIEGAPPWASATASSSSPRWAPAPQDLKYAGEDTELVIGDDNQIREFTTLHIGTAGGGGVTRIGNRISSWPTATWRTTAVWATAASSPTASRWPGTCEVEDHVIMRRALGGAPVHPHRQARLHRRRRDGGDGRAALLHRAGRPRGAGGAEHRGAGRATASPRSRSAASRRRTRSSSAPSCGLNEALAKLKAEYGGQPGDRPPARLHQQSKRGMTR